MTRRRALVILVVVLAWTEAAARQQVFRARVDAVVVDVSVTERNRPIRGLTARDFELTDNGVPQRIADVGSDSLPLDVTLIVDMSGRGVVQPSLVAGVNNIRKSLRPADRARIITFTGTVCEWTPLADAASIPRFPMPAFPHEAGSPNGPTACYDAIALSIVTPPTSGRRQLAIVFSADRDTTSFLDARAVLDIAKRSDSAVFVVRAPFDLEPTEAPREGATRVAITVDPLAIQPRFFRDLAEVTGGRVEEVKAFTMMRNDSQGFAFQVRMGAPLGEAFVRALEDFRSSYVLRYMPEGVASNGWHDISVRVANGGRFEVRARSGYVR